MRNRDIKNKSMFNSIPRDGDKYNLISAVHSYLGAENNLYNNLLPPLELLKEKDLKNLIKELNNLKFEREIAA